MKLYTGEINEFYGAKPVGFVFTAQIGNSETLIHYYFLKMNRIQQQ